MPRNAQRRMPQVEDFPPVGQREFRAKAGGPSQAPLVYGEQAHDTGEPARRPGFFERITGRMRRGNDSYERESETVRNDQQASAGPRAAPQHAQAAPGGRQRVAGRVQDEAELPVFFSRERK